MNDSPDVVIRVENLSRNFGSNRALDSVSLDVPRGTVFGLVGANGAGKTTLIRHVLGLLRAQRGSVRVFGIDPVADPVGVLGRLGYLSEENDLPGWMRVEDLLEYVRSFYPSWDGRYADELIDTFELDVRARVKTLSKGQRARVGLISALAYRPELLVLDEPSSGLDPIVRRDILSAIIRTISDEGRTVLFSSHLLDEVERVSDHVAMLAHGKLVLAGELTSIKESHRQVTLRFDEMPAESWQFEGLLGCRTQGDEVTATSELPAEDLRRRAADVGASVVDEQPMTLDQIFVTRASQDSLEV